MEASYFISKEYRNYLGTLGINGEKVFKKVDLPLRIEKNGIYVTRSKYIEMVNAIEDEASVSAIIRYSDISKYFAFVPPVFAGLCGRNGIECFKRISTYKKLIAPFILKVDLNDEALILTFTFDDNEHTKLPKFTQMTEDLIMVNLIRTGTGKHIIPTKIESTETYPKEIIDYLGVEVTSSKVNRIHFSLEDVNEPFLTENNIMWKYLEPEFKKRMEEMEVDDSFGAKVRTLLMELIPSGNGSIESVAKEMALSPRTLQRKLSEEQTTFIKQLNHTRELMSKNYLMNETISTEEVAYLLGYSDMYVFMRAFKQWTGLTVKQFKTKHDFGA